MLYFDLYPVRSRLRLLSPDIKMGLFVIYTSIALLSNSVLMSAAIIVIMTAANLYLAKIGFFRLFRLMLIPVSFVLIGSVSVIFEFSSVQTHTLLQLNLFDKSLYITQSGLHQGLLLFTRSFSAIMVLYALILNTPATDMIYVLRKLKAPEVLLDIMFLVYRNIFIFSDTAHSIHISQKSRLGYKNLGTSLRSSGKLGGRMFVIAGIRAENLYQSMESRCYNGKINTLPAQWKSYPKFMTCAILVAVGLVITLFLIRP